MATSGSAYTDITCVNTTGGLTGNLYCFVRSTGTDTTYSGGNLSAVLCISATGGVTRAKGILQNEPDTGQACVVRVEGQSKLVAGEAIAVGAFVSCSTAGTGLTCGTTGEWAAAIAESASTAAGQVITVRMLNPGLYYTAGGTA